MTEQSQIPLVRSELVKLRVRALRRGVWFKVLSRVERGLLDLAIKVVDRVRSLVLARSLGCVVKKLVEAMESRIQRLMGEIGDNLALKLSQIAQDWGNESAVKWAGDSGFIRYLTITYMNKPL